MQSQNLHQTHPKKPETHQGQTESPSKELIYDLNKGQIDVDNLPEEIIKIFKKAGIKKKDLKNPEYAEAIFEAIVHYNQSKSKIVMKNKEPQKVIKEVQKPRELIYDHEKGQIDIENLPADLIEVFKKAGIRKKDLKQKEFAEIIFQAIADYLKAQNEHDMSWDQQIVEQYGKKDQANLPPGLSNIVEKAQTRSQIKSKSQIVKFTEMNQKEQHMLSDILKGVSKTINKGEGDWSD